MQKPIFLIPLIILSIFIAGCAETPPAGDGAPPVTDADSLGTDGISQGTNEQSSGGEQVNLQECLTSGCAASEGAFWYEQCLANCHIDSAKYTKNSADCNPILELPEPSRGTSMRFNFSACLSGVAKASLDESVCAGIIDNDAEQLGQFAMCVEDVAVLKGDHTICQEITVQGEVTEGDPGAIHRGTCITAVAVALNDPLVCNEHEYEGRISECSDEVERFG